MGLLALIEFKCPVTGILYCEKSNFPEYLLRVYGIRGEPTEDDPTGLQEFITDQLIYSHNKKPKCPPILPLPPLPLP
jgi:hypothetical protein